MSTRFGSRVGNDNFATGHEVPGADEGLGWNRKSAALALLSFAMLTVSLDQYIVVVAPPEIGRELGYSAQTLQSVISAYVVTSSGFLLLGGRAADLLGRRRIFVSGLAFYGALRSRVGLRRRQSFCLPLAPCRGLVERSSFRLRCRWSIRCSRKAASATGPWRCGVARAQLAS
jgi:MFS family permease